MSGGVAAELRKFVAPELVFGSGARFQAVQYIKNMGINRVMVVSDPGVIQAGWTDQVIESIQAENIEAVLFSELTPNPKDHEVMSGVELYQETECAGILVVGGGSPLDCGKGIAIVVSNGGHILDYEGVDTIPVPIPPMVCIPTTAGTAADVSQFAIITDTGNRNKIAIISKAIVPDVALLDPETTLTMDPFLTACTGLDALTHAVEAYVSNANSPITDLHSIKAIELVYDNLAKTIASPDNIEYRQNMVLGCLEAGLAFSNASLGAVHAMAHSLGGYLDLPHGECNAILLGHVMNFNYPAAQQRYEAIGKIMNLDVRKMSNDQIKVKVFKKIEELRLSVGVTHALSDLGVHATDINELSAKAVKDPCLVTNPRKASKRDLGVIYEEAI